MVITRNVIYFDHFDSIGNHTTGHCIRNDDVPRVKVCFSGEWSVFCTSNEIVFINFEVSILTKVIHPISGHSTE